MEAIQKDFSKSERKKHWKKMNKGKIWKREMVIEMIKENMQELKI